MTYFIRLMTGSRIRPLAYAAIGTGVLFQLLGIADAYEVDVGVFLLLAEALSRGLPPYLTYVDHKPPGIYLIFLPIVRTGLDFIGANVLAVCANAAAAIGVAWLCAKELDPPAPAVASGAYLIATAVYAGTAPFTDVFLAVMVVAALVSYRRHVTTGSTPALVATGVGVGTAMSFKQPAIAVAAAVALHLFIRADDSVAALNRLASFALGLSVPLVPLVAWFASAGGLEELFRWTVAVNVGGYAAGSGWKTPVSALVKTLWLPLVWVGAGIGATAILADRPLRSFPVVFVIVGVLSLPVFVFRPFAFYFIDLLPAATVLLGYAVSQVVDCSRDGRWRTRAVWLLQISLVASFPIVIFSAMHLGAVATQAELGASGQRADAATLDRCVPDGDRLLFVDGPQHAVLTGQLPDPPNVYYHGVNRNVTYTNQSLSQLIDRHAFVLLAEPYHPGQHDRLRRSRTVVTQFNSSDIKRLTLFAQPGVDLGCQPTV